MQIPTSTGTLAPLQNTNSENLFSWKPLGGLGEVGMNCMVFYFGRTVIPIDAGVLFADSNDFGIEAIHPDYSEILLKDKPKYWIITHAHEDHIGAVQAILSICHLAKVAPPIVLAPPFAAGLIKERLLEGDSRYPGASEYLDKIKEIDPDAEMTIDDVKVRFVEIRHSTVDSCSIAFEWNSPHGALKILHTSDFKIDEGIFSDGVIGLKKYDLFKGERADILFIDSTNAERDGQGVSELDILPPIEKLIREQEGRVFLSLFASNIFRISALIDMASRLGRQVCLAGRSMESAFRVASSLGLPEKYFPQMKRQILLDSKEIGRRSPEKQLVICSGSQGEFRSALSKLAYSAHPDFSLQPGDAVILSSKTIPGNEKSVSRLVNGLLKQGAKVLFGDVAKERAGGPIHASGHARRSEIQSVINLLRPRHIVPCHGEMRQLVSSAEIAHEAGKTWSESPPQVYLCEDGAELVFANNSSEGWQLVKKTSSEFPPSRMLRFDRFVAPSRDLFLKSRKKMALGGVVSVCLDALGRARVEMAGVFPETIPLEGLKTSVEDWLFTRFKSLQRLSKFPAHDEDTQKEIADELEKFIRRLTGVRPQVIVHLVGL